MVKDYTEGKTITIGLHPYIAAYLSKGIFTLKWKWGRNIGKKIKLLPMYDYDLLEYHFYDKNGQEIHLN